MITVVREDHDDDTPCPIEAVTVACPNGCDAEPVNAPGSEAWYLEAATRAVADGVSNRSELRKWHEAGVRTPARRKRLADGTRTEPMPGDWTPTTFLKLLRRPRNAGLMEVAGKTTGDLAVWPAIVGRDTWDACQAVLQDPSDGRQAHLHRSGHGRLTHDPLVPSQITHLSGPAGAFQPRSVTVRHGAWIPCEAC